MRWERFVALLWCCENDENWDEVLNLGPALTVTLTLRWLIVSLKGFTKGRCFKLVLVLNSIGRPLGQTVFQDPAISIFPKGVCMHGYETNLQYVSNQKICHAQIYIQAAIFFQWLLSWLLHKWRLFDINLSLESYFPNSSWYQITFFIYSKLAAWLCRARYFLQINNCTQTYESLHI